MEIQYALEEFPLARTFRISREARDVARVVRVTIRRGGHAGQGESVPYARYGESPESVLAQLATLPAGITRAALQEALPPGAARNAADCALWDLEAKAAGQPLWQLAGLPAPTPRLTAFTLPLDTAEAMGAQAAEESARPLLKIKLGGPDDLNRLRAVRQGAPAAKIIVDANEGWQPDAYLALLPALQELGVALVEQPFPAGQDAALAGLPRPVPICADESVHVAADLPALAGRYDMVNVKLDKSGGLTAALELARAAQEAGLGIMAGCMVGTSLAMAPAVLIAQMAEVTDLDGPLLLARDRSPALSYAGGQVHPAPPALWG